MTRKEYIKSYALKFNVSIATATKQLNNFYNHLIEELIIEEDINTPIGKIKLKKYTFTDNFNKIKGSGKKVKFILNEKTKEQLGT